MNNDNERYALIKPVIVIRVVKVIRVIRIIRDRGLISFSLYRPKKFLVGMT